jgi:DNA-binding CsgD family transcriptional regulator
MAGKLNGYEAQREIRRPDGTVEPIRIWIRRLGEAGSPRCVLAVFSEEGRPGCVPAPPGKSEAELTAVLGTTDSALQITQISVDAEHVLGDRTSALIGRSLLSLFLAEDAPSLLWALAQAATGRSGVTLRLHAKSSRGEAIECEVLLVSLEPATAFGFALLPSDESLHPLVQSQHMTQAMWRLSRETRAVSASREAEVATLRDPRVLSSMSSREIEIVLRLLSGDRVPEIARSLYLAQGTVRNHLSSVFRRLNVSSQQELIALLRGRVPPGS